MRKMLLSFKADVYRRVLTGEKIYEHRKVFPDEEIEAYLYVSHPVKAIVGIMHLGRRQQISEWKNKYAYDADAVKRIDEYLLHHKYAMEILDFQDTEPIALEKLRQDVPGFVVPQMYYYLDGTQLQSYLENNLCKKGNLITHQFDNIECVDICKM